ncbi:MAG: hypothetical protein IJ468_05505 [Lachnospiraceae bacterium]|nr:hypothetical protein [Lachnospiraceae bacterium]
MSTQKFTLTYPWDTNGYKPEVEFFLTVTDAGFSMCITAKESNPRRVETKHLNFVHPDSCVEWFVNFMPQNCDRYFNFEVNANGTMYVAFRKDRYDYQLLTEEDVESLGIKAEVRESEWEVIYTVPFALIEKYIPGYQFTDGMEIRANFYKCGDETEYPHYGLWNPIDVVEPDFHRPEFFGAVVVSR